MEEFSKQGSWWLPEMPGIEHGGVLSYTFDGGLSLALFGAFNSDIASGDSTYLKAIHGIAGGEFVTLCGCSLVRRRLQQPTDAASGRVSTLWSVRYALVGGESHFTEEQLFSTASVELGHLRDWLGISGIETNWHLGDDVKETIEIEQKFRQPKPIIAELDGVSVGLYLTARANNHASGRASISERCEARITVSRPRGIDDWLTTIINPFRDFLNFSTSVFNYLTEFFVFELSDREDSRRRPGIRVVHSHADHGIRPADFLPKELLLFSAEHIEGHFGQILRRWFDLGEEIESALALFFGAHFTVSAYPVHRFYTTAQAIESYHRHRRNNLQVSEEEFAKRIETILAAVPADSAKWLREKLRYANEPSLRMRLKELAEHWTELLTPLVKDRKSFVEKVVITRNYYTHYGEEVRSGAATDDDLKRITDTLLVIMQACLLEDLGFTRSECTDLVSSSAGYWLLTDRVPGSLPPRADSSKVVSLGTEIRAIRAEW